MHTITILIHMIPTVVKDMGNISVCLRLQIFCETLSISQTQYILSMLRVYKIKDCTLISTLIDGYESTAPARPDEPRADSQLYLQAVGSLRR
jgi:hypothetical protein